MKVDVDFSDEDAQRLKTAVLGKGDPKRIAGIVAQAGAAEGLAYATGRVVPTTITDLRDYRIYCLLNAGMTVGEAERLVAGLFKISGSRARGLVDRAVARYSVELGVVIHDGITALLESARPVKANLRWEVPMPIAFLQERVLESLRETEQPDPEKTNRGSVWSFPNETYQWLREEAELAARAHPDA
ncbi:MAG TPA: hypothetical protein VGO92_14710 [Acidimicrobiales bacterium]|jgi:hypothetical protein|nr:hypothetical protein [Acidimicrobiales bacterium]